MSISVTRPATNSTMTDIWSQPQPWNLDDLSEKLQTCGRAWTTYTAILRFVILIQHGGEQLMRVFAELVLIGRIRSFCSLEAYLITGCRQTRLPRPVL